MSEDCPPYKVKGHPPSSEKQGTTEDHALMPDDEVTVDSAVAGTSLAQDDARALVRLVQCSECSRPFRTPVTLPCGHSACRACLPQPHARLNISYPDTVERQMGICCSLKTCKEEHPIGDVNVDVTLSRLMKTVELEIERAKSTAGDVTTAITVIPLPDVRQHEQEKQPHEQSHTLSGGKLLAAFTLAEHQKLPYEANIIFSTNESHESDNLDATLIDTLKQSMIREAECQICYTTMLDPVTTSCGHTFCRRCLTRALDHSVHCPACRRALRIPASLSQQKSNARTCALLQSLCPEIVAAHTEAMESEESTGTADMTVPLFVCTMSFPGLPTFLHIFEPRYRLMMRRAIESNRQFGMLIYNRSRTPQGELGVSDFCEYGTMLHILHMQVLPDGRSIIETRGLYRFRVLATGLRDGYHIGRVEKVEDVSLADEERFEAEEIRANTPLPDSPQQSGTSIDENERRDSLSSTAGSNAPALESMSTFQLFTRATDFVTQMRANSAPWLHQRILDTYGEPPSDPAAFPYWFASVLPISDEQKYLLLTTTSVRQRLKIIVGWIRGLEGQRWYSGSNCTIL